MKLIIGILAALALVALAVSINLISHSPANAFQGAQPPAEPTGLLVSTTAGSLDVSADWNDVQGADEYRVRWRLQGPGNPLNEGIATTSSAAVITVTDYGNWVVRVEACNDVGCGSQSTRHFMVEPQPNRAPVVDEEAEQYASFVDAGWAPRGILVSKVYDDIFSDPDGDNLTFTVSVPEDCSGLVDTVYIQEEIQRVFIRLDAAADWGAVKPQLPKPLVTTVTLTATDPDGLSASVTGDFQTNWESSPTLLSVCDRTPQVRDALVALIGKNCKDIGARDLDRVVRLDLSNTGLSKIRSKDFSGMSNLREVDASSNDAMTWSDACGADKWGASVTDINLDSNELGEESGEAMPGNCFVGAPNVQSLHLGANWITSLPANAFGNPADSPNAGDPDTRLTELQWIDLSSNVITTTTTNDGLPEDVFNGLSNLFHLDLGRQKWTDGTETFDGISSLGSDLFDGLSSLEELRLNNNALTTLSSDLFDGLTSLKNLDLAHNDIPSTGLPDNIFTPLSSLEGLALFGNEGSPFTLTNKGVRSEANVLQVEAPPGNFQVEPGDGKITLSWTDPNDTNVSHQYRYQTRDPEAANPSFSDFNAWTDISSPTD